MVDVSVASTESTNPAATQNVHFDAATQSLRDWDNNHVDARRLSEVLGDKGRSLGTGQAGNTTLRRNALFKSLLQSVGNRTALLESIHRKQDSGSTGIGAALENSFYSRGATKQSTVAAMNQINNKPPSQVGKSPSPQAIEIAARMMASRAMRESSIASNTHKPEWTTEEAQISTPYSETEVWRKMLEQQFLDGGRHFNGPPGMWEEVVARLSKPV